MIEKNAEEKHRQLIEDHKRWLLTFETKDMYGGFEGRIEDSKLVYTKHWISKK